MFSQKSKKKISKDEGMTLPEL
ncbi:MAG: hypothetical protein QOJ08_1138, partial [Ilumatobacteraceae bacterium]